MQEGSHFETENKKNRYMQFVSREMARSKRMNSYAQQPRIPNGKILPDSGQRSMRGSDAAIQIYSRSQFCRRRGAGMPRSNSKSRYSSSFSKLSKQVGDESMPKEERGAKAVRQTSQKGLRTGSPAQQPVDIEELHYEMVRAHQNVRKMQKDV